MIEVVSHIFMWVSGLVLGYILWAPDSAFKRSFVDGMSLGFLWKKRQ
jgi:hypothetical protein